ncbi:MAG: 4Fe-4S dicluster domain-containing protein [Desulfarculaceae bacterium]|jgi:2-oxoglutarate ferredoxin oxidoreductase subunit delta
MNRIIIDEVYCKGCGLCIAQCPAQVLETSQLRNQKGYLVPRAARLEDCTGCGMCELICPDMCLTLEKLRNETGS